MKINPIHKNMLPVSPAGKVTGPVKKAGLNSLDQVSFSEQALEFSKLLSSAREEEARTPAQQARIDDIGQRIRQGTYEVNAGTVAYKILKDILL